MAYPELVSRGVSKSRKCKWLVKVGASNGVTPMNKKMMVRGGFRATEPENPPGYANGNKGDVHRVGPTTTLRPSKKRHCNSSLLLFYPWRGRINKQVGFAIRAKLGLTPQIDVGMYAYLGCASY